jgi:hypothetical protein
MSRPRKRPARVRERAGTKGSVPDAIDLTRIDARENPPEFRNQTEEELDLVATGDQDHEGDRKLRDGLLIADALVGRQENVELALTATACSRVTVGKSSRKWSSVPPSSR